MAEVVTEMVGKAEVLAEMFHRGQRRKFDNEPYIHHPRRVAETVRRAGGRSEAVAAALLHDVLEDCDTTEDALRIYLPEDVVDLVVVLTRRADETHHEYVERVARSGDEARLIKRSDILDNLSTLPLNHSLVHRYITALKVLFP